MIQMYNKSFYITDPVGNNAFSFEERKNKKIYVPSLKKISSFDGIELGAEIAFQDYSLEGDMDTCYGLKNFYEIDWNGKKIFLFDNHNHAYFFWYLSRDRGYIGDNNTLIHIDEHADTRDPGKYLMKPDSYDLEKVFYYTNYVYNVGNYIIPAQKEGIIGDIVQIRSSRELENYLKNPPSLLDKEENQKGYEGGLILNLDLDFFQPDLDFIGNDLKKSVVLDAAKKARVISVATSPFFINQELAIKVFKDIFS